MIGKTRESLPGSAGTRPWWQNVHAIARIFWTLSVLSILIWAMIPAYSVGWDVDVYRNAIHSLRAGHSPYADAIAVQQAYQANPHAYEPGVPIPYSYVYSPMTLPVLRWIAQFPLLLVGGIYWTIYWVFATLTIWLGMQFFLPEERAPLGLLATIAIFFPALLENDVLFSGNIAYILYGVVLLAAFHGWRRGRWMAFYTAVLVAGCFKAPMLSLLAIPVFSARRQWWPALATGAAGVALFVLQPHVWPQLFHEYMRAVQLQFDYNRDFSSSPAGLIANALFFRVPYQTSSLIAYLALAALVGGTLLVLSRKFFAGLLTLQEWAPLLLVGTILLNPRVMEYDIAPITLPVLMVVWRFLGRGRTLLETSVLMAGYFAILNVCAAHTHTGLTNPPWKLTAGVTLSLTFAVGAWDLWQRARVAEGAVEASVRALEERVSRAPSFAK